MAQDVASRIIEIIARQAVLEPEDISTEQTLADLGIDSMGLVEAIFAIEETFDIEVPYNANQPAESGFKFSSVGAVIASVEELVTAGKK